jgi:hypothetical protein
MQFVAIARRVRGAKIKLQRQPARFRFALLAALLTASAWSAPSKANAPNAPPVIDSFTASPLWGEYWVFEGHVSDEDPLGCTVFLMGGPLASATTAMVQENGNFSAVVPIVDAGTVHARAVDLQGLESDDASVDVGF